MNAVAIGAVAGGALLSPLLLIPRIGERRFLRGAVHMIALSAFAVAGGSHAREGNVWAAFGIVAAGAIWVGAFWLLTVRESAGRREGETPESERESDGEGEIVVGADTELEARGRALLKRFLDLERLRVGDMTVPRDRITYAELSGGVSEVLAKIRATGHLRIPMADRSLDRIVGIAYAKDILPHVMEGRPAPPLKGLMRRPLFVSKDRPAASLLDLFRTHRGHLAIVVDEYNRTVGLVTRDDVFRALAGNGEEST